MSKTVDFSYNTNNNNNNKYYLIDIFGNFPPLIKKIINR